ncbi:MAG: polysaccharide biosynthesis tyrosine autokinase [Anaerolineae bacterium]|nr:polysaccharide biosynthesis tyrosine autokinase [Anaerolineae bacterium]
MELRNIGRIFWKWLWLIALGAVVAGGVTFFVSTRSTPIYRASTQILIQQANNPTGVQWTDVLTSERLAANYARLLTTRPVLNQVATNLRLPEVTSRIIVDPVRETQIIVLHVEDPNPALATAIANDLPAVFKEQNEKQLQERFNTSLETFQTQIGGVQADIDSTQAQLQALQGLEDDGEELTLEQQAQRARLETSLAQYRSSLADLLGSRDDVKRAEALSGDTITVVEPAIEPTASIRPRVLLNTLIAAALGALLMTALAFLIEYLDDTIKLPEDAARVTGLPALGSLVQFRNSGNDRQLIAYESPKSPFTESYRTLRTNIQFSSLDKPINTLMVTSASPAEGKSTTVANLAVVIAQGGKRTILVDTDLRRPVLHQVFGLPNAVGVTNALLMPEGSDLTPFLQQTEVDNLWLLASGPLPPNPSELLGSHRMAELMKELRAEADMLVFDSPPTLAVTDAAVLARQVDGVLLVVESAKTREAAAKRAAQGLLKVNANVLGVAVNRIAYRLAGSHYYYYDYYQNKDDGSSDGDGSEGSGKSSRKRGQSKTSGDPSQPAAAGTFATSQLRSPGPSAPDNVV